MNAASAELAAAAARLVVDEGMEYAAAKRKAARDAPRLRGGGRIELPSNELVEEAVREHLALFHADTQPAELHALRTLALTWMNKLAPFRPHLSGAVWRGTATRLSSILLDLYADDEKAPEIALINLRVAYEPSGGAGGAAAGRRGEPLSVLSFAVHDAALDERVTIHLLVHDHDDLRGALQPDTQGRTWRGDARALDRLIEAADSGPGP